MDTDRPWMHHTLQNTSIMVAEEVNSYYVGKISEYLQTKHACVQEIQSLVMYTRHFICDPICQNPT